MAKISITDETINAAQAGDNDSMWQIVSAFDPILKSAVRAVAPSASVDDAEDLLQEARAALVQRVRDYDSSASSAKLQTYAHHNIRRMIGEAWARMSTGLSADPSSVAKVRAALAKSDGNLELALLHINAVTDARGFNRMSRETFMALVEAVRDVECLDAPVHIGKYGSPADVLTLADTIPDTASNFTDPTERRDLARWLVKQIPPRQSYALCAFYGVGMTAAPDPDVAAHLRVTPLAVRKLRSNGVTSAQRVAVSHDIAA